MTPTADDPDSATADHLGAVVVIDDNETNRLLLQRILAFRPGLEVLTASDGQRGLELVRERKPDLVLTDINLPTMGGEEILRTLKSNPETAHIPVIVVSGDVTPQTRRRLLEAGAQAFLEKPFPLQTVLDLVDDLVDPSKTRPQER
jgi:CheY-like chemotaxis protein